GGDLIYLSRAYGPRAGFLFAWSQMVIIRPGDIALMAFVFARYGAQLIMPFADPDLGRQVYAAGAVVVLTAINILGVSAGARVQNALTVLKVLGLLVIIVAGLVAHGPETSSIAAETTPGGVQLAFILVLFTYGGWSDMGYVAAEVRDPERNIVRALVMGTVAVTVLYVAANTAFLHALGRDTMATSKAVAVDTVATVLPSEAGRWVALFICISALGACNGLILTGGRITYALGRAYHPFRVFGHWAPEASSPQRALLMQGVLSLVMVLALGSFLDTILYAAPVAWLFFLGTACAIMVLRYREPDVARPFRVPLYPVVPLLFVGFALFMLVNCVTYALDQKPWGLAIVTAVFVSGVMVHLCVGDHAPPNKHT
ncbi:MAG: amino acid permease, partial [Myxococcota bacterium]